MFNLERFKHQLGETIAWCVPRVTLDDLKNSLRNVLPASVQGLYDYELNMGLVESAIKIRSTLLEANNRNKYTAWKKPVPPFPTGLAEGRLLVFYPNFAIYDPVGEVETNGFFDSITIPAWDTWIYSGVEAPNTENAIEYLICWIPPQIIEMVNFATEADPTQCIQWLNKTTLSLSFVEILKEEGLLA